MQNWKKKTEENPIKSVSLVYFLKACLLTKTFSWMSTTHPIVFLEQALWTDSEHYHMK